MMNGKIVREDVAHFEHPLAFMFEEEFTEDGDLDATLVFPGPVIRVVQVLVLPTVELECLGSHAAGQRHLHGAPISPSGALADSGAGVVVGVRHEES